MGYFHALKLAFLSSLIRKYMLWACWEGFYQDFSTKNVSASGGFAPWPHQGAPPPGPPQGGDAPWTPEVTSPPLTIYPGAAPAQTSYRTWTSCWASWFHERSWYSRSNCKYTSYNGEVLWIPAKGLPLFYWLFKGFWLCEVFCIMDSTAGDGNPFSLDTPIIRNLYDCQAACVRTEKGYSDWFNLGQGVRQGCILSPSVFNLYAEYIMS